MAQTNHQVQAQAIIETPKGSRSKFKFDVSSRSFKLSKVLPEGMVFPYDFGYLPGSILSVSGMRRVEDTEFDSGNLFGSGHIRTQSTTGSV